MYGNPRSLASKISRKLICLLLSFTLVSVQAGCYTTRVTQSIGKEDIYLPQRALIEVGQLARISYRNKESVKNVEGTIKLINAQMIIITQRQPGKYATEDITILQEQIQKIDLLNRKLDVVASIFGGALGAFVIWVIIEYLNLPRKLGD